MTRLVRLGGKPDCFRVHWLALAAALAEVAGLVLAAWVWIRLAEMHPHFPGPTTRALVVGRSPP
jgi:hypothetical protein